MDASSVCLAKVPGDNQTDAQLGLELKQIFFTNLQLLGFDPGAMEMKYRIPFNKDMFNLPNKAGAEAVLYFLFNRLNLDLCRQEFRDCWPVTDKKTESQFRKICCIWLQNIQKEETDARLPRINASLFLSPGGDKFYDLIFSFSCFVLLQICKKENGVKLEEVLAYPRITAQNKDLGQAIEKTIQCAAIRHRRCYVDLLGLTVAARQCWKDHANELGKESLQLAKEINDLERSKRDLLQRIAKRNEARGSPTPAALAAEVFDSVLSENAARRAERLQEVRDLWRAVEEFLSKIRSCREIFDSILNRTLEHCVLDAGEVMVSIPHMILAECEREIRRRQIDNIYEAGKLNLLSVLQLGNIALRLISERIQHGGLKDLSTDSACARSQAHTHHAYLSQAITLREKMLDEIPKKKGIVAGLRAQMSSKTSLLGAGFGLTEPSPPRNFDPLAGPSGTTPKGSLLQRTPEQEGTPEAASKIVKSVCNTARRSLMEDQLMPFDLHRVPSGVNRNNSNTNNSNADQHATGMDNSNTNRNSNTLPVSGPKASHISHVPWGKTGKQQTAVKQPSHNKATGQVQPRVVRHISRQSVTVEPPVRQKTGVSNVKRSQAAPAQQAAGTHEKHAQKQTANPAKASKASEKVLRHKETPRECAHNILADKIVWAVMHGEGEEGEGTDHHFASEFLLPHSTALTSAPLQQHLSLADDFCQVHLTPQADIFAKTQPDPLESRAQVSSSLSLPGGIQPDFTKQSGASGEAMTPCQIVQEAWMAVGRQKNRPHPDEHHTPMRSQLQLDRGESSEAEDVNLQDPLAALSEDAFAKHDLIHRSPLERDIQRMWQDVLSHSPEKGGAPASDKLPVDGSFNGSSQSPTPTGPLSPAGGTSLDSEHTFFAKAPSPQTAVSTVSDTDIREGEGHMPPPAASSHFAGAVRKERLNRSEEEEEMSLSQTLISDGLLFSTSFDEHDSFELPSRAAEKSGWEERTSALYDDGGDLNNNDPANELLAFNLAMDEMFHSRTPSKSRTLLDDQSHTYGSDDFRRGEVSAPFVSATQHFPRTSSNAGNSFSTSVHSDTPMKSLAAATSSHASLQFSPADRNSRHESETVYRSPNSCDSKNGDGVVDSGNLSSGGLGPSFRSSPKNSPSKKVTFSPDSSSHSTKVDIEDDLLGDDDFMKTSGLSPLNDSFTPLRSGLFLQGKSPARPGQQQSPDISPDQNGTGSRLAARDGSAARSDEVEEDIQARLARLHKMAAEALRSCQESGADVSVHMEEEEEGGVDGGDAGNEKMTKPPQPPAGAGHLEHPLQAEQFDIFCEDDSMLLPSSP